MSLSNFLSSLFTASEPGTETESPPATASDDESSTTVVDDESGPSTVHECRTCGTNVSADTSRCPACDGEDIVTYSID